MFRSVWSKTLWEYRVAILGWGIGLGLLMTVGFAAATPTVVLAFASLAPLFRFLGDGFAIQTPEGYITFRYMGAVVPLMLCIWMVLAGAHLVRGEEERGTLDVLLATPQPRIGLLLQKVGALFVASLLIAVLIALGIVAGESILRHVNVVRAVLTGVNVSLLAFVFSMVALLISQFTTSRGAASGGASVVLLLALLLDITGRQVSGSWVQHFSPFYYYNLNHPLIPSFPDTPAAALVLLGLSVLLLMGSLALFVRRDIGRPIFSWQRASVDTQQQAVRSLNRAERSASTRSVSLQALSSQGWPSFWWLFGILLFCDYILLLTPSIQKPFYQMVRDTPWLRQIFFDTPTNTNAAMLGTLLFTFMPALVIVFAMTLALKWSADLENGRLEMVFSTPQSRTRVMLERYGATFLVVLLAPVLTWLSLVVGAQLAHLEVDQGRIAAASFNMLPPALIVVGLVYALAGRVRYAPLLVLLTVYIVLAFFEEGVEGMVQLPTWLMSLSIFHLYGNPVFLGMNWNNFLGMLAVAVVLLLIGLVQFHYADVERG